MTARTADYSGDRQPGAVRFVVLTLLVFSMPWMLTPSDGVWPVYALGTQLLLLAWALLAARGHPGGIDSPFAPFRLLLWLAVLFAAYLALKLLPLPPSLVGLLSPGVIDVHQQAGGVAPTAWLALALDAGTGIRELFRFVFYLSLMLLVMVAADSVSRAHRLALWMVLAAVVMATLVLAKHYLVDFGQGRADGPFGNANLFAGFMAMNLAVVIGLYFGGVSAATPSAGRAGGLSGALDGLMSIKAVLVAMILVLAAALFASGSRGGALALMAALALSLPVYYLTARSGGARYASLWIIGVLLVLTLSWFGSDTLLSRLESDSIDASLRSSFWRSSVTMIEDFPLFGLGAGTWQFAYPGYWDPQVISYAAPKHAHNDHLQMIAENGLIGYLLLGAFVVAVVVALAKGLIAVSSGRGRGLMLGALTALVYMLLHNFADNNFQVTVTVAYLFVYLGLGLVAARDRA